MDVEISIRVEPNGDGTFDIVTRKDGEPWVRLGPIDDLDAANELCSVMLQRALGLKDKLMKRRLH